MKPLKNLRLPKNGIVRLCSWISACSKWMEATRRIRSSLPPDNERIPVIAMTANAFENERREAERAGMDGHLTNPID